jgi:predicted nucleic acid-binding protein
MILADTSVWIDYFREGLPELAERLRRGIGYVDAHLLAAAAIKRCQLWTKDKRLRSLAASLDVAVIES